MLGSQLDLTDRIAIESGLFAGKSFKEIAERINRSPSTVSREVRANREYINGTFFLNNDCRYSKSCQTKNLCGDEYCGSFCIRCSKRDCREICPKYKPYYCERIKHPPYVCNTCSQRRDCFKNRFFYSAKTAQFKSDHRRSSSRKGVRLNEKEIEIVNDIVVKGVKKGQPLAHIYEGHKDELSISIRSIYNYIDSGLLSVKNIDLRRKVKYKKRKIQKDTEETPPQQYRIGRSYDDFCKYMMNNPDCSVVQMDTVKGKKEKGSVLLTMLLLKYNIMLLFLLPNCKAASVTNVFDFLTNVLGIEAFKKLFSVILTDNGPEFKRADELELTYDGNKRCMMFYCDPMASWQKGELEKNHEYIRYVIPKGKNLDSLSDEQICTLMNHINSVKRPSLKGKCPYDFVTENDIDMLNLMRILKMDIIAADNVHLKPNLLN